MGTDLRAEISKKNEYWLDQALLPAIPDLEEGVCLTGRLEQEAGRPRKDSNKRSQRSYGQMR